MNDSKYEITKIVRDNPDKGNQTQLVDSSTGKKVWATTTQISKLRKQGRIIELEDEKPAVDKPGKQSTIKRTLTRLQPGDVIEHDGTEHLVWFVNNSRASAIPFTCNAVQFRSRSGQVVKLTASSGNSINISPNSEVPILSSLGQSGLQEILKTKSSKLQRNAGITDNNTNNDSNMAKKATSKGRTAAESNDGAPTQRSGKCGQLFGYSITAVIRTMAVEGFNFAEAQAALQEEGITVADNTIKIQLSRGRTGAQPPAPVNAEVKKIRPKGLATPPKTAPKAKSKPAAKPAKSKAAAKKASKGTKKVVKSKGKVKKTKSAPKDL
ncbi:MAG: hypothetical protein Unbinned3891contig1000_41 [Prokaryotic dsDNA virus sp.]|nr:MAG: hypothetical protein Unbinned3891contig1000_41 [Prokaryotic dsDNA virus sp.]|tara:strand:- start:70305 stop:71276 length:972 start_codon:yes stop_codon:yes gene_type:complete